MINTRLAFATLATVSLLGACVELPTEPHVRVIPGSYKPFEVFQSDDQLCRSYAQQQVNGRTPGGTVDDHTAGGAITGAAVGAASGALLGQSGAAAGIGAGIGLLIGAAVGSDRGNQSAYGLQRRYDDSYQQCMYAKGNQIPGYRTRSYGGPPPPPVGEPPPPPPPRG